MKLKQKDFREGLSITCEIDGTKIDDAKLHLEEGEWFICQNKEDGWACDDLLGYKYSWSLYSEWIEGGQGIFDIQLKEKTKEKTMDNLEEGDILVDDDDERLVLGVCGKVYHLSDYGDFNKYGFDATLQQLKDDDWKLKDSKEEKAVELTLDQIANEFGCDVKKLKIKKEK